ncbi:MAG TPA: gamma-glutamylcyclotransferase family protein [Candidatus Sulfotelmatobacter sp.]|jgi:hypothetical protein|nr:gamma-glutamylcyclotransferase family protein [Candidatus Sulfotelmatobacter sp.]
MSSHVESDHPSERLFSYGTLQLESVQLSTFGRLLDGQADQLSGYRQEMVKITDPEVVATSGKTHHPIVIHSGDPRDAIPGMVFFITSAELARADSYEVADYKRVSTVLASGLTAWVYVDARE